MNIPDFRKGQGKAKRSKSEDLFAAQCMALKLTGMEREYLFAREVGRKWRFDFAWPDVGVACELEGIIVRMVNGKAQVSGRHVHPAGLREDNLKYASAAILGWWVIRFEQTQVKDGTAIELTTQLLRSKGWTQ